MLQLGPKNVQKSLPYAVPVPALGSLGAQRPLLLVVRDYEEGHRGAQEN